MKYFTSLLMIVLFSNFSQAQNKNYNSLWKQVENLEIKGLPKSALEIVNQITNKAKEDNNQAQVIKCLLFKSKFAMTLEEEAQLQIISEFKTKIEQTKFPTKNILESLLANMYWQYFQQNRWKFYNRTNTSEKVDETDFRTWDLETLFAEIQLHFINSLENGLAAQQTPLSKFNDLLQTQENSKIFRPSLYDFLCHQALQFFKTDENSISKPAYKFELNNPELMSKALAFSKLTIESKDSNSLQLQALKIYQSLIKFHLQKKRIPALTAINIERLQFVKQHATFNNKEDVYLKTLQLESNKINTTEFSGLYDFEIASIFNQQANLYNSEKNKDYQWKNKEALELCEKVIKDFPTSNGAKKCLTLKNNILQNSLNLLSERFIPIQTSSRLLVTYKNYNALDFKVCSISEKQLEKLNQTYQKQEQLQFIKKLPIVKQWQSSLKNEGDYQTHTTEIVVPKLANGSYLIYANNKEDQTFAFGTLKVTNIAVVEKSESNTVKFQLINRNDGKPLSNITAKIYYQTNSRNLTKTKTLISNEYGEISFEKTLDYLRNIKVEVTYKEDFMNFGDFYVGRYYPNEDDESKTHYNAFIFTDRSIYRPSQTVYFKGILLKTREQKSDIIANKKVIATLYNVNDEELKEIELLTNEYGSVAGEFILPSGGLTGEYYINLTSDENDLDFDTDHYFSVEEYKRPKFETHLLPITETIKVNDHVTVNGEAKAYAGSVISNAKVVYRVKRNVQYPRWYFWYHPWFNSEPQEITHGETTTNEQGEYSITFKAQPDQSVNKDDVPIFNYEITADVTDINGETRSTSTIVKVGYHALLATITIPEKLDKNIKNHLISIDTKNLNNEFTPAEGTITIHKLQAPQKVLRKRPWQAPDYQEIPKNEFTTLFPHDAYSNEDDLINWKKGKPVFSESFYSKKTKELSLGKIKNWESGNYIIELNSKDKFGQEVKDIQYIQVFSKQDKTVADNQLFFIQTNQFSYQAGEKLILSLGSATKLTVTVEVEKNHKITQTYLLHLDQNKKSISIPVKQEDVGGFVVHYSYAGFNSFNNNSLAIRVPYPKTELEIETLTFRNKLQPGQDETWNFKIKGPQGEKVSAEILASMYDASLDAFKPHTWEFSPLNQPLYYSNTRVNASKSFGLNTFKVHQKPQNYTPYFTQSFDQLNWFGFSFANRYGGGMMVNANTRKNAPPQPEAFDMEEDIGMEQILEGKVAGVQVEKKIKEFSSVYTNQELISDSTNTKKPNLKEVIIRKNLQETAFFFPQLQTDAEGNVHFSFTSPEALTKWKLQLLAHTKTLESSVASFETVTQKELMVTPNLPRFFREGDTLTIQTKISNISKEDIFGEATIVLLDAFTLKDITQEILLGANFEVFKEKEAIFPFTLPAEKNTNASWKIFIPEKYGAITCKIIAKAGNYSDGEQSTLPVLSNRMLVTETLPMWIRSNQTKKFTLNKLKNNTSTTLKNHQLSLEITSNPAWYAVQALPYLMEYPYECNEQTFSRYYANALASHITNSNPRIQEVFNQWKNTDALLSNLEKNQELKSLLIQETPWLRDAQSETEQKKRIALLFDLNKMQTELDGALRKLQQNQMNSGGWSWFKGGRENRFITQHIITGFGHLKHIKVRDNDKTMGEETLSQKMIKKAIHYLDAQFVKQYKDIKKYNKDIDLNKDHLSYTQLQYMYMRSFFPDLKMSNEVLQIMNYYHSQIKKYWLSKSLYAKGLMTLITYRRNDSETSKAILLSLKENSITSEELGMYWKDNTNSWFWYQAPIETQSLLIEAFSEAGNVLQNEAKNLKDLDNLKIWLLKNKQTNRWKTTKATTQAVYALLLQGSNWLSVTEMVEIVIGEKKLSTTTLENVKVESGTGYFKTSWKGSEIQAEMAEVQIVKKGKGIAWGALYWQYFEDLDKITSAKTPLQLSKKLFIKKNTDTGEQLTEIASKTQVKIGDLVRVRIELKVDRPMEFVHLKDMRASGFEPINVISTYKWQDGLGYYESTKDAATHFFFDYLPKGVYVFEYDLRANNVGNFSNGISTIQSMYAPEFSSHSKGVRVQIE
ncbi:MAG: alpha-2-macroglobulin family protein [Flavobacteriales bacterium]